MDLRDDPHRDPGCVKHLGNWSQMQEDTESESRGRRGLDLPPWLEETMAALASLPRFWAKRLSPRPCKPGLRAMSIAGWPPATRPAQWTRPQCRPFVLGGT